MWWVLSLLLLGCRMDPARFATRSARASCALYADCDLLAAVGGDVPTCEALVVRWELAHVGSDQCIYDSAQARRCVRYTRRAGCDDLSSDAIAQESPCDLVCGG